MEEHFCFIPDPILAQHVNAWTENTLAILAKETGAAAASFHSAYRNRPCTCKEKVDSAHICLTDPTADMTKLQKYIAAGDSWPYWWIDGEGYAPVQLS